jgi:hypothetical protein
VPLTVQQLLAAGRIEVVPTDVAAAQSRLITAQRHLVTAKSLVDVDTEMAYCALYDAARKAATAHMLANGFRAPAKPGAHETVGLYAAEKIADPSGSMGQFQRMRRRRNKAEYDDIVLGAQDVEADLVHARNIVNAVAAELTAGP